MIISELIQKLEEIKAKEGDVEVNILQELDGVFAIAGGITVDVIEVPKEEHQNKPEHLMRPEDFEKVVVVAEGVSFEDGVPHLTLV